MTQISDLTVPRVEVSELLMALGVHLDTSLASSFLLGATDMLMAAELAATLPEGADYLGAVQVLESFKQEVPEPVRVTIQAVYLHVLGTADGLAYGRLTSLGDALGI